MLFVDSLTDTTNQGEQYTQFEFVLLEKTWTDAFDYGLTSLYVIVLLPEPFEFVEALT